MIRSMRIVAVLAVFAVASLAQGEPWRFVVTGDSRGSNNGVNTPILGEIATAIAAEAPEFVLFVGDLVDGNITTYGTLESQLTTWRTTMQPVYAVTKVYAVRGNHEVYHADVNVADWNAVFTGDDAMPGNGPLGEENITFSFEHENALVIGLDHYGPNESRWHRVDQTWLNAQLDAHDKQTHPHVFTFAHEPAFSVQHVDCMDDFLTERNAFWDSIRDAGVKTFFCGHDHFFNHAKVTDAGGKSLHQMLIGTAGAPTYPWSVAAYKGENSGRTLENLCHVEQYGYMVVEVDGLDVTMTWKQRTGADAFAETYSFGYTVPEPATMGLLALGFMSLLMRRKRS